MTIELKARASEVKQTGEGRVQAVFATMNVIDKDGDVTIPGAFGEQEVVIVPAHNWGSVPLGKGTIREIGEEAIADLRFNLESQTAAEWFSALKFDLENGTKLQEWSYGFTVKESEWGDHEGERVRFLKRMDVHEVSPVLVGAGENTRTLAVKSANDRRPLGEQIKGVLEDVRDVSTRIAEIRDLRARKGKDISEERLAEAEAVTEELDVIVAAVRELKVATVQDARDTDAALREAMAFEVRRRPVLTRRG